MSLASPEKFTDVDESGRKTYAYFDQDGRFVDTFTLPVGVYDSNRTLEYGVNERKFIIHAVTNGILEFPSGKSEGFTLEDFRGQLEEVIAEVDVSDEELSLSAISKTIMRNRE